jgi:NitT/TauT family transport system ATP-binding protein
VDGVNLRVRASLLAQATPLIRVEEVTRTFGAGPRTVEALGPVSFEVRSGEFFCIVGPSGCGKSTLLDLVAGFARPDTGRVLVGGRPVLGPDPRRLLLFQEHALLPWRSARANVELGLELAGVSRVIRRERAADLLREMGLAGFENARPRELSGGMRQRVSIARALAVDPDVLLMDEPLGAVDALTRLRLQDELLALQRRAGKTIVLVTHDIDEAVYLGDRVAVMSERPGRFKTIVRAELPEPRDRGSAELFHLRERILEEFRLVPERQLPEYAI